MSTKNFLPTIFFIKTIYLIFKQIQIFKKKLFLEIIIKNTKKGFVILFTNSKYCGKSFEEEFKSSLKYASHLEVASGFFSYELLNELKPQFLKIASLFFILVSGGYSFFLASFLDLVSDLSLIFKLGSGGDSFFLASFLDLVSDFSFVFILS